MATDPITQARINKLREGGTGILGSGEFGMLLNLALDQLVSKNVVDHSVEALRASLAEQTKRLETTARLYSEAQQTLGRCKRDLDHSDNFIQSLVRRLQNAVSGERTMRDFQNHFVEQVHNCMARKPISPECSAHPTLLRLQEALESAIHEAPPAE